MTRVCERLGIALLAAALMPQAAFAQTASPDLTKGCTVVGAPDASSILGYDVQDPDETARAGGICSFVTRRASEEGIVAYSVVTADTLDLHRQYFRIKARFCGGVQPHTLNYAACKSYVALATAADIDAYYAARIDVPEAKSLPDIGNAASTATAVYVKRGGEVFECVVRRTEFLDVDRSIALAKLLLARVPELQSS